MFPKELRAIPEWKSMINYTNRITNGKRDSSHQEAVESLTLFHKMEEKLQEKLKQNDKWAQEFFKKRKKYLNNAKSDLTKVMTDIKNMSPKEQEQLLSFGKKLSGQGDKKIEIWESKMKEKEPKLKEMIMKNDINETHHLSKNLEDNQPLQQAKLEHTSETYPKKNYQLDTVSKDKNESIWKIISRKMLQKRWE
jgi:hypothetical protein